MTLEHCSGLSSEPVGRSAGGVRVPRYCYGLVAVRSQYDAGAFCEVRRWATAEECREQGRDS
jgi:hypothetical protein